MNNNQLQEDLFQGIKSALPSHLSLVDEIAELLDISTDSAYRRIRGETPITLEELQKLCVRFKLSLDQVLKIPGDNYVFSGPIPSSPESFFETWIKNVMKQFHFINSFEKKYIYFLTKDFSFVQHFQVQELAAFKYFFWMKSILHNEKFKGVKFNSSDSQYDLFKEVGQKAIELYNQIPTTEIWNTESIHSTLRQIEFYREAGLFESKAEVDLIYDKVEALTNHMERQAEYGKKFSIFQQPEDSNVEFKLFANELILGDNSLLVDVGVMKMTFINHGVINIMGTRDERFNKYMHDSMMNMIKKSNQISTVGEKERIRFFNRLREKIEHSAGGRG